MRKTVFAIIGILLMGILANPLVVSAQEKTDDSFVIAVNGDENLSDAEKLTLAKDGLEKALSLALEKVTNLTNELNSREFDEESTENTLKSAYLEDLNSYATYYSESLEKSKSLEDLESVQNLAKEIKDYRDTTYGPGVERIVEFVLVFYSEDVINKANERLEKVSEDIGKLEGLGLIEKGTFDEKLEFMKTSLEEASRLRLIAKDIVVILPQEDTTSTSEGLLIDTEAEIATTTNIDGSEITTEEESAQSLLEQSLNDVKGVYEVFVEISRSVKETLGID